MAVGDAMLQLTDKTGLEHSVGIFETQTLVYDENEGYSFAPAYTVTPIAEGEHANIIENTIDYGLTNAEFENYNNPGGRCISVVHTHPYCLHKYSTFSDFTGDQGVVDFLGMDVIYLVEPSTGLVLKYEGDPQNGVTKINRQLEKIVKEIAEQSVSYTEKDLQNDLGDAYVGKISYQIPNQNKRDCINSSWLFNMAKSFINGKTCLNP